MIFKDSKVVSDYIKDLLIAERLRVYEELLALSMASGVHVEDIILSIMSKREDN